jgi:hypothetical protein
VIFGTLFCVPKLCHFAVDDALVSFGDLVERVGLGHYFDFSRCSDLERFVQKFAIVGACTKQASSHMVL